MSKKFRLRSPDWNLLSAISVHSFRNVHFQKAMSEAEDYDSNTPTSLKDSVTAVTPASSVDGALLVEDLLKRCHDLLNELDQFRAFLAESKKQNAVEIRQFHNSVLSELKSLERVCEPSTNSTKTY